MNLLLAPPLHDPFEKEHLLFENTPVLRFGKRAFEVPLPELLRWLGLDLAAGVPHEIGVVTESLPRDNGRTDRYAASFYSLGPALAITTEIDEGPRQHRVVELHGAKGDLRVRLNLARESADADALGQVRVFGGEPGAAKDARASIARHLKLLGVELETLRGDAREPVYTPAVAARIALDPLGSDDSGLIQHLVGLARAMPADGPKPKPARRLVSVEQRVKRGEGQSVLFRYELHRAGTGVVHTRRREVESGPERPGLVRAFNVVGLRGGARLRVRDVAGRTTAEVAGAREAVDQVLASLRANLGKG